MASPDRPGNPGTRRARRAPTIDEITLLRATTDLHDEHNHLEATAAYTLLEIGLGLCEVTDSRIRDLRQGGTVVRAVGKWGWCPREIRLDPWQERTLASVVHKLRVAGAGPAARLAYRGNSLRRPGADASTSPVVRRLIERAQLDANLLLPKRISISRARHHLEALRDWRTAAALVGLLAQPDMSLGGIFGRLCDRCRIRQEDALDGLTSGPPRYLTSHAAPIAGCLPAGRTTVPAAMPRSRGWS